MEKTKRNKGFTLIEILVVIGIIAILAAIVLIAINPAKQFADANNTQRTSNVNAILNSIGQYMVDNNGRLPTNVATSTSDQEINDGDLGQDFCEDLVPTYMPALPVDPASDEASSNDDDGQISADECDDYETGYVMDVDGNGRVTIKAPLTQISSTTPDVISVTR